MKDKVYNSVQAFSRAIIQPVMFMAVTGIIISITALLKLEQMPNLLKTIGEFFFTVLTNGTIGQLSVIFCVGIATAIAKKKKTDAAIMGISVYLIFLYANNFWLNFTGRLAEAGEQGLFGTGQNMVLGVQVTDMGVFLGIILGCVTGFFVNKLANVKFHKYLSPYEGTKFAYLILIFVTALFAVVITYVWPTVNSLVNMLVAGISESGPFGFFIYGFSNRMLLPFGLHHLLWMPLYYTPLGGSAQIAGETFHGAMNIWLAELGNISEITSMHPSIGYLANFGYTALPLGIALAIIKTAKSENKQKVKAILIPAVVASCLAGITEPIEFLFLFLSPILWVAHGIIYGLGLFVSNVLGLNMVVENVINTLMYSFVLPMNLGKQWLIPILFVLLASIEYFVFKLLIVKLNIPTLGRGNMEEEETVEYSEDKITTGTQDLEKGISYIVDGLGGKENIETINNCYTRLRIDLRDPDVVDENILRRYPMNGIIKKNKHIQLVIGLGVQHVREDLENFIKSNQ
ncbi:PTS transporter subunit EIIC [Enterococcus asini]|uniref:PTS transporter subunit EIIC n=1 Tax=Enterococcus asini TaxID=57732 RepID=UPI00288FA2E4|nr:PTS transporter subunit EIIC [Enterococcus asini]MDT2757469.1 PTS transporter subunit EIIC [Enterococcus asini]